MENKTYNQYLNDPRWLSFSDEIKKERNYTCEDCGYTGYNLRAHHIKYDRDNPKRLPWDYYKKNMKIVCAQCHAGIHGIKYAPSHECGPCDGYLDCVKKAELRAKEVVRAANEELEATKKQDIYFRKSRYCGRNSRYKYDFGALLAEEDVQILSKLRSDIEVITGPRFTTSRMTRLFVKFALMHEEEVKAFAKEVMEEIW